MGGGEDSNQIEVYEEFVHRKVLFILAAAVILVILFGLSLSIGSREIPFLDTYRILIEHILGAEYTPGTSEWFDDYAVMKVRLPEALFAIIGGASLGVAAAAMQSVMNNPLADAYTTGISSGACFGVAVAMVLGFTVIDSAVAAQIGTIGNAFVFALIPMVMIMVVSKKLRSPASLILAGVAISYFFNGLTSILMLMADAQTLEGVYEWQIGSITGLNWDDVPVMAVVSIFGMIVIYFLALKLNVLSLGDANAKALGLDIENLRLVCLIIISLMVASVIAFAGVIGFVGLVCPHIVRFFIDADNRYVIPASGLVGAIFLLGADMVAGALTTTAIDVPVGVVLSLIGAPIFLALIMRRDSYVW